MKIIIILLAIAGICSAEYSIAPQPAANGVRINSVQMDFYPRLSTVVKYSQIVQTCSVSIVYDFSILTNAWNGVTNGIPKIIEATNTVWHTVLVYPETTVTFDAEKTKALSKLIERQLEIGTKE